jgi:hypothetical protein
MRLFFSAFLLFMQLSYSHAQFLDPVQYPTYAGNDLGLQYSTKQTSLRIWSPTAVEVEWTLYDEGEKEIGSRRSRWKRLLQVPG